MTAVGLIVNPCAGIGGEVGLHGSDGPVLQTEARRRGALARASARAEVALRRLLMHGGSHLVTVSGEMGEMAARRSDVIPHLVDYVPGTRTTARDTIFAARALREAGVDLLMFVGGDGTARDVVEAVGQGIPTLGVPAGVKVYSACYAITPAAAGDIAHTFLADARRPTSLREVIDIEIDGGSVGRPRPRLFGVLVVAEGCDRLQARKLAAPPSGLEAVGLVASAVISNIERGVRYVLGPGGTTAAISTALGCRSTLLGVDVVQDGCLLKSDVSERELFALVDGHPTVVIVAVIGGQGFVFGRGNQQISARVLRAVGRENIWLVADERKLSELVGMPLLIDTGDDEVDDLLAGPVRVLTGPLSTWMSRIASYD